MTLEPMAYFIGGLLGSAHCVGMCGGFALAIGATKPALAETLVNQLVYSAGRIFTYTFLGALAGVAGARLSHWTGLMVGVQQAASVASGIIMLLVAVSVLFRFNSESFGGRFAPIRKLLARAISPVMACFVTGRSRRHFLLAGVFTGFLPCGLLYAFLALAVASANPLRGMTIMSLFGLGTVPAMAALGCGAAFATKKFRHRIHQIAASFVLLLGLATIARGLPFVPCHWLPGGHATTNDCHCSG